MAGHKVSRYATLYLRLALASAYLSSVTSRFGVWGKGVGWGNFANFLDYTAKVNPFLPRTIIPALGWFVTIAESILALFLIAGFRIRETAFFSGLLLILFAIGMTIGVSVISPFDYSVYTASAASFLLAVYHRECFLCVDAMVRRDRMAAA
ncbi:MAG TPA: hypothetical protein VF088_08200 [Pyrinomonadaceae bacterium]